MQMTAVVLALGALIGLAACVAEAPGEPAARQDYADFCAACHGPGGKGDGPAASAQARKPPDLTRIAARNGGVFPMARVMTQINGYTRRGEADPVMPGFSELLEGQTVLFDSGDGIPTPTPARLVALAEYLRTIQD